MISDFETEFEGDLSTAEQAKRARTTVERAAQLASSYNLLLSKTKYDRGIFHFDPHTRTAQPVDRHLYITYIDESLLPEETTHSNDVETQSSISENLGKRTYQESVYNDTLNTKEVVRLDAYDTSSSLSDTSSQSVIQQESGKRTAITPEATKILREWLYSNLHNPYPTDEDKNQLSNETGLPIVVINTWFVNARRRTVKKIIGTPVRKFSYV